MSRRQLLIASLAIAHLIAVMCGAIRLVPKATPLGRAYRAYAVISGACNQYGFFAPRVGSKHRATFTLHDAEGRTWSDVLAETDNPEARLRLTGVIEDPFMSGQTDEKPEMRKRLIQSVGAKLLNRHPSAVSITVEVQASDIPTIDEFRAGARPGWTTIYRADVQRRLPSDEAPTIGANDVLKST